VLAKIVDTSTLLKLVGAAFAAGVGVTVAFSLVILGTTRSLELRRDGSAAGAGAWAVLAVVAFAAFAGTVVYGIHVMTTKS
jgi:uncharacterized membrane protein YhaH (DUF805 family)